MDFSMKTKKELSREYARRYQRGKKKDKKVILDEFLDLTGYNRCYASYMLRNWGKEVVLRSNGTERLVIIGDFVKRRNYKRRRRKYDESVFQVVEILWRVLNFPCGKRFKAELSEMVKKAIQFKEIQIPKDVKLKLNQISASTIDRMLKPCRKKYEIKSRSRTKPGTLLKKEIRMRTGVEWEEDMVGYLEVDLVSHDGGNSGGDFCQTLNSVDIKSGWTEMIAVKNKAQIWVFEALMEIRKRLPFSLKGIDSDNCSEFINHHLLKYCIEENIDFTRGRASHKNDNCYVEEKNFTAVRNYVGHYRYDNEKERAVLNELYVYLRLYLNYFQPQMKLKSKKRIGAKIIKKYNRPVTPYQRLLYLKEINGDKKKQLKLIYSQLNPFELNRKIEELQRNLFYMVRSKREGVNNYGKDYVAKTHVAL